MNNKIFLFYIMSLYTYKGIKLTDLLETNSNILYSDNGYRESGTAVTYSYGFKRYDSYKYTYNTTNANSIYYTPFNSIAFLYCTNQNLGYTNVNPTVIDMNWFMSKRLSVTTKSSGTFTIPSWCTIMHVILVGGGGKSSSNAGGGGGGNLYIIDLV